MKKRRKSSRARRRRAQHRGSFVSRFFSRKWLIFWWFPLFVLSVTTVYLDFVVRAKFDGKKWALPARVYASPMELYVGLPLRADDLARELKALGYQFVSGEPEQAGQVQRVGNHFELITRGFLYWDQRDVSQYVGLTITSDQVVELKNRSGEDRLIARLEPQEIGGIYPRHQEDRLLVRLEDVPALLGESLIAVEDKRFRDHFGISIRGIARAMWANVRAGEFVQGGSTLTQQLVKNFYLTQERSLWRKAREAPMAILLELHYSKKEILETYINEVYLGQSGRQGVHGFALASQHYFRQPLAELQPHQIALLVGLVKGASYYNPWRNPERALERRNVVLGVMATEGLISEEALARWQREPLDVATQQGRSANYPAFLQLVKQQLQRDYRDEDLRSEGLRVFTTLSPTVQAATETAMAEKLNELESRYRLESESLQAAAVVSAVGSGEILAVVGGRDARFAGFNRALDARRPIGSLVKPAVYLSALQAERGYTLASVVDDSEITIPLGGDRFWQPQNFSRQSHGPVTLLEAFAESYNQATARLGMSMGVETTRDTLLALGAETVPDVPAILLGAVDMSPLEVNTLYQTIASDGVYTPARAIRAVLTAEGQPLQRYALESSVRFSAETMHLLHFAMQTTMRMGTGRSAYGTLPKDWQAAGKTGTSDEQRDSWFAGFGQDHLAVVWVGRDDNGPTPLTGATGAMQIWAELITGFASRGLSMPPNEAIEYRWVDYQSGLKSKENCKNALLMPFIAGTAPVTKTANCEYRKNPLWFWLTGSGYEG